MRYRHEGFCIVGKTTSKLKSVICVLSATLILSVSPAATSGYIDQIGPDPMRSESCIVVTPHDSMVCFGVPYTPQSDGSPILTIGCDANFLSLTLQHRPVVSTNHFRKVTLRADHGELTANWLAGTSTMSLMRLVDGESDENSYYWVLRLMGVLATPGISRFEYSIEDGEASGGFEFDYSDQKLMELIIPSCSSS